jgi:hypothetical protein
MEILSTYETFFIIVEIPNREGECLYQNKSLYSFSLIHPLGTCQWAAAYIDKN